MPVGKQPHEHFLQQVVLPDDDAADLGQQAVEVLVMAANKLSDLLDFAVRDGHGRRPPVPMYL